MRLLRVQVLCIVGSLEKILGIVLVLIGHFEGDVVQRCVWNLLLHRAKRGCYLDLKCSAVFWRDE